MASEIIQKEGKLENGWTVWSVEGSIDIATADTAYAKGDEILERTKEPVQISRIIFEKGAPIRESIITTIFAGVRNCMIAYGNATTDWEGCLRRIPALKALTENDRQTALVAEDERIISENKKAKEDS